MSTKPLTPSRLVIASIMHWWRGSASVALGIATATAVIVGALLVGDSMRGSLRSLTIERLGRTHQALIPGGFFVPQRVVDPQQSAAALIWMPSGVVERRLSDGSVQRAGNVQIIGCEETFWDLDTTGTRPIKMPDRDEVVVNESTAKELGIEVGDQVTIRLPKEQAVPADSPLGRRESETEGLPRMTVIDIVADQGLGQFALFPSQATPLIAFLDRETIAQSLERDGQANALLFDDDVSAKDLHPSLADLALSLRRITRTFSRPDGTTQTIYDYYSLTSERLLLPDAVVNAIDSAYPAEDVTVVLTYLANAIEKLDASGNVQASVPYSTITAIESNPQIPLDFTMPSSAVASDRSSAPVPLVINDWTSEQLNADVGTPLRIAYYEPEVENGREIERYFDAIVTSVVPITRPAKPYRGRREAEFDQPPTVYNDPDLTPIVPGVTDQDSISDWDLPFQLQRKITPRDDQYWNEFRLTPKAFLPLSDGQRLFGSRFGNATGLRIAPSLADDIESAQRKLLDILTPHLEELGWSTIPVRQQQLDASRGTTPFDGLFLSLSFFVILAAVMLIAMLFRLGLVQRTKQFGTLLAVGWTPRQVMAITFGEGLAVAAVGALVGVLGGVLYAKIVLWALRSWWVGAITVPFLNYHWTWPSLAIGAIAGWLVAAGTLFLTTRALTRLDARSLLSGARGEWIQSAVKGIRHGGGRLRTIARSLLVVAILIAAYGATLGGQAAAGAFVGSGMLLLISWLMLLYARMQSPRRRTVSALTKHYSVGTLAARSAARNPTRSALTIGLMATAAFLIIAISAFRLEPSTEGTGGFDLIAESAQALYRDLRDETVRRELLGPDADRLQDTVIVPMRLRRGQDASCNNLYQATAPTVLGIPSDFDELFPNRLPGFQWASAAPTTDNESPWQLLQRPASGTPDDPIPVVLDQNTAMWSLHLTKGIGQRATYTYNGSQEVTFEIVGLLANSMLQGKLIVAEENFERAFPTITGYQYFLIADSDPESIGSILENRLGDLGMDVIDATRVLAGLLAVQNTYLRTFQSLGGLGLLLGTIGLAIAQLRNVLERRRELAVLRAIGFTRGRLAGVVMTETSTLLLTGIGLGAVCAVLAVLPYALTSGLKPPIVEPVLIVIGIIAFGLIAGILAVGRVVRMPLLESLRSDD